MAKFMNTVMTVGLLSIISCRSIQHRNVQESSHLHAGLQEVGHNKRVIYKQKDKVYLVTCADISWHHDVAVSKVICDGDNPKTIVREQSYAIDLDETYLPRLRQYLGLPDALPELEDGEQRNLKIRSIKAEIEELATLNVEGGRIHQVSIAKQLRAAHELLSEIEHEARLSQELAPKVAQYHAILDLLEISDTTQLNVASEKGSALLAPFFLVKEKKSISDLNALEGIPLTSAHVLGEIPLSDLFNGGVQKLEDKGDQALLHFANGVTATLPYRETISGNFVDGTRYVKVFQGEVYIPNEGRKRSVTVGTRVSDGRTYGGMTID